VGAHRGLAMLVLAAGLMAAAPAWADDIRSMAPSGEGVLTICPIWAMSRSCRVYHHIRLPARISVGDRVPLDYGSNPKHYRFPVAEITQNGSTCTILSRVDAAIESTDHIEVPCRAP